MRLPRSLDVLHERSFARYLAAVTVSTLGSGMAMVALAFAVLEFGGAIDLGIVLLAREIPIVILLLLGGVFADRLPRRTILVGSDLVKGSAQVVTAILLFSGTANVWNVALLQTRLRRCRRVLPARDDRARQGGGERCAAPGSQRAAQLSSSVLSIAGPAIGALIVAAGSPAWAIAIDSITFFASAALTASMHLAPTVRVASASILARPSRRLARVHRALLGGGHGRLVRPLPAHLLPRPARARPARGEGAARRGRRPGARSWPSSPLGAVVGGMFALRLRVKRPLVACQLFVLPAGMLLAALAVPLPLIALAVVSFAVGIGFALGNTLWTTALQRNVPDHALSRISSFDWLGSVALNPIGYALIGPIAARSERRETLVVAAVLNIAVCLSVVLGAVRAAHRHDRARPGCGGRIGRLLSPCRWAVAIRGEERLPRAGQTAGVDARARRCGSGGRRCRDPRPA